jgi:lipid A oxidase
MIDHGALALAMGVVIGATAPVAARAEVQIQVYGGVNGNFSSDVSVRKPGVVTDSRSIEWDGKSFAMPPYWGARGIYWIDSSPNWGVAIEFTHAKAYAKLGGAAGAIYDRLEFTDGNNIVTANVLYRFDPWQHYRIRPYAGLGVGLAVPHVEVELVGDPGPRTFEYQVTGVALQGLVGLEMPLGANWSGFIEGKMTYTRIDADLKGGGSLKTDLWSPHFAVGLSYRF